MSCAEEGCTTRPNFNILDKYVRIDIFLQDLEY